MCPSVGGGDPGSAFRVLLGLTLDIVDRGVEFLAELLDAVVDTREISSEANGSLRRRTGFLNMRVAQPVQAQLRRVEWDSVVAVHGCCCTKGHQRFLQRREFTIVQEPTDHTPLVFELRIGNPVEPAGDLAKRLSDFVQGILSGHGLSLQRSPGSPRFHCSAVVVCVGHDDEPQTLSINRRASMGLFYSMVSRY